ncbi:MAG: peptidoglycan-binding protein [Oscillospiraceae bacterium]|jgi:murein L,D-transpeptidase YcbB/YkuD|nr:peptidoglycan-binding protein [Oscillospiraceae bacterium]
MAEKTYKRGVTTKLSANFKSTEFDCKGKGCCSTTKIESKLIDKLEQLRKLAGNVSINVTGSGYRCKKHNAEVDGASTNSNHMTGSAADINIKGRTPKETAKLAETCGFTGIILYKTFVHVDLRSPKHFYDKTSGSYKTVSTFGGKAPSASGGSTSKPKCPYAAPTKAVKQGTSGNSVKWVQWHLKQLTYKDLAVDGKFGSKTLAAVKAFQKAQKLEVDGSVGPATRSALQKAVAK